MPRIAPWEPPEGWTLPPTPKYMKSRRPIFCWLFTLACCGCFIMEFGVNGWKIESAAANPMLGPAISSLVKAGAKYTPLIVEKKQVWRLMTCVFLHTGIIHIVLNLLLLHRFGTPFEQDHGVYRTGAILLVSGACASLSSALFLPQQVTVGASGALFGMIGAFWGELIHNYDRVPDKLKQSIMLAIATLMNLIIGLLPGMDNFAHVGGLLAGILMGMVVLVRRRRSVQYQWGVVLGCAGLLLVFFIVGLALLFYQVNVNGWCTPCRYIGCVPTPWWKCSYDQGKESPPPPSIDSSGSASSALSSNDTSADIRHRLCYL